MKPKTKLVVADYRQWICELKTGKFQPKDIGQLGFYMTAVDRQVKSEIDGKTIGMILCRSRNDIVAEYAIADLDKSIGVSPYQFGLPTLEQLQMKLQKVLATPTRTKKGILFATISSLVAFMSCRHAFSKILVVFRFVAFEKSSSGGKSFLIVLRIHFAC